MGAAQQQDTLLVSMLLNGERDRAHLEQVMRLAGRMAGLHLTLIPDTARADVVIVRRGEAGGNAWLVPTAPPKPIAVVYTSNARETHAWQLRDPARTADLVPVFRRLQAALHGLPQPEPAPVRQKRIAADAVPLFR